MLRKIFKYLFGGIVWGCTFFVLVNLIGAFTAGDRFLYLVREDFVRQALGAILCGVFCAFPAIVYTFDRLPYGLQVGIHFAVGLTGYFVIAYKLGWMPMQGVGQIAGFIGIGTGIFFAIWFGFYLFNRIEAKRVNERLRQLESEETAAAGGL